MSSLLTSECLISPSQRITRVDVGDGDGMEKWRFVQSTKVEDV
jgi:hypothetical protein